ncbi:putative Bax inhibitor 1 [Styela clava]|uniref:probable Bax inhibitor 1 n=1 Tax=Styela clava TaxID=7725 RepID=UPI00193A5BBC|nr:probable Bax inhibitor 1 [Styela clava]
MDTLFGNRPIKLSALSDFSQLSTETKKHLKNVYTCLMITMASAGVGAYMNLKMQFGQGGLLTALVSIGLMIWLATTAHNKENQMKRLAILSAFGFTTGIGLGPLINLTIQINPQIVVTAFMTTSVIFACFTLAALYAQRRSLLYLGGICGSGLTMLLFASLLNIFVGSTLLFQANLYIGIAIFSGFILYDTQLIVEKHVNGDNDYIWHSVDLFLDFINLFRRIMILLASNENKNKRKD